MDLPAGTDSVAPIDAVKVIDGHAEALLAINPGDGVLTPGPTAIRQSRCVETANNSAASISPPFLPRELRALLCVSRVSAFCPCAAAES